VFIALPTSCLVENGFSLVTCLLSNVSNRLAAVKKDDLSLPLTTLQLGIETLAVVHHTEGTH
jgi:hypothetical protein